MGPKEAFENGNIGTVPRHVPVGVIVNALPERTRRARRPKPPREPRTPPVVETLRKALELAPDNVEVIGNLARLLVRTGRKDDRTRELLGQVVMKDHRPEWTEWARERLALMGKGETDVGVPGGSE